MADAKDDGNHESSVGRLAKWFDSRLGLSHQMLRPAPQYAINPLYWLGALAVVAFVIQSVTGMLMMLYYVPDPTMAYSSTQFVIKNVSYGRFLESVHLYTAYAMIMLVFMHLIRGYFVSVHKKPREIMWVVGMLMGFITLGMGFTGYLLPWTVVSKSATDVGVGMISALPPPVSSFLTFLLEGGGGDAAVLLRFFDLHIVVLPAILLVLLLVKMYMLEAHGVSEPVTGPEPLPERRRGLIPIFPDVSFYLVELATLFGAAMLLVSVVFPLTLPPEYSAATAGQYVAQPDWYFLWIYQILKLSFFEPSGPLRDYGLPLALSMVTLIFVILFLLPFIDRGRTRRISRRPVFVTLGLILVAELGILTIWGYLTPGSAIPDEEAAAVLGGVALIVIIMSMAGYKLVLGRLRKMSGAVQGTDVVNKVGTAGVNAAAAFVILLGVGAFTVGSTINALVGIILSGATGLALAYFAISISGLSATVILTCYLLYRIDLGAGTIRRRIRAFEVGWKE